jgi:hypothetical protein
MGTIEATRVIVYFAVHASKPYVLNKKAQESRKLVGPIEICCNEILFGVWEEECRTPVRKAAHPLRRGKLDTE